MKKKLIVFLISILIATDLPAQTGTNVTDSIISGGIYRSFIVYVPAKYNPSKPVPLVFNLHGLTSNKEEQLFYGEFRPIADTANFILVVPDGTVNPLVGRNWNSFFPPGSGVDDVGFISHLIDTISSRYSIDLNRVYSTGMSNGAYMSYYLACFLSNRIAAVASVAGSMVPNIKDACTPQHPTPIMEIHGTTDAIVPYDGGNGSLATDSVVQYWIKFNHCFPTPVVTAVPNISSTDNCTAEHQVFDSGNAGSTVEFYKITDGGHTWPGAAFPGSGNTNLDFNASKEIWRFFRQYSLDKLTGVNNISPKEFPVTIFPNPVSDVLTIYSRDEFSPINISISDVTGKEIYYSKNILMHNSFSIPTSSWSNGVYLLSVADGNKVYHEKFVKTSEQ